MAQWSPETTEKTQIVPSHTTAAAHTMNRNSVAKAANANQREQRRTYGMQKPITRYAFQKMLYVEMIVAYINFLGDWPAGQPLNDGNLHSKMVPGRLLALALHVNS